MNLIDLHCDTLWLLSGYRKIEGFEDCEASLKKNPYCISIEEMKKAGTLAQFFACFTYLDDAGSYEVCYQRVLHMIELFKRELAFNSKEIPYAGSYRQLQKNQEAGKISAFLTVEEAGILNGKIERLTNLYEKGVRLITPIWNYENCIGYPNSKEKTIMEKGLKPFGFEVLERMSDLSMIADVSHASDGSFWDILSHARSPVIASHLNCRAICNHPRNLTDDMIRALAERGGLSGLNFYGYFLNGSAESRTEVMAEHVLHMIQKGGEAFPAIGTDFDGFDGMSYEDIPKASGMKRLWETLKKKGLSERQLELLFSGNALRILKEVEEG